MAKKIKNAQPKINKRLGRWLYLTRKRYGLNQTQLAPMLGLDQSALSRAENGRQQLTAAQLFLLFEGLKRVRPGTSPDYRAVQSLARMFRIRFIRGN